ncbi:MAG TPA: hypothetical protein VFC46_14985 [Humisphaera sp.]|nr:hypothetical protein [Humisphaera sp.]
MTGRSFILFPGAAMWRVGAVCNGQVAVMQAPLAEGARPAQIAASVSAALHDAGYSGEGTILAIPSSWCFAASIAVGDLPKNDRQAMLYRLEEKLPLAAEAVIADFIHHGGAHAATSVETALGVCVQIDAVRPLVEALEAAGVAVASISPAALLAVQDIIESDKPAEAPSLHLMLLGCDAGRSQVDLLVIDRSAPVSWSIVSSNISDLKFQIDMALMEADEPPRIDACDIDATLVASLSRTIGQPIAIRAGGVLEAAGQFAGEIGSGRRRPWVEFRRGAMAIADPLLVYRKPLNFLLASAVALLVAISIAMFIRIARYERAAQLSEQKMVQAFSTQFPGWPVPANVKAVVESEYSKSAVRGGASLPIESGRSALQTLDDVIGKLPADARFTINQMTLEDSTFEIQGRVRSYEDVDAIAAAARKAGMDVPPPQARKDGDGFWSFTLRGARSARPPAEVAKGTTG